MSFVFVKNLTGYNKLREKRNYVFLHTTEVGTYSFMTSCCGGIKRY